MLRNSLIIIFKRVASDLWPRRRDVKGNVASLRRCLSAKGSGSVNDTDAPFVENKFDRRNYGAMKSTSITSALDHMADRAIRKIYKWFTKNVIRQKEQPVQVVPVVRPTWDEYGMLIAQAVSKRAACSRRQVGAVIFDEQHRILSTGYNGVRSGDLNCSDGGCPRGLLSYSDCPPYGSYSNCKGYHAEHNAIQTAQDRGLGLTGATIYVIHEPCEDCSQRIMEAGIIRVVSPNIY